MTENENFELRANGYTILRNKISVEWLDHLSKLIDKSFEIRGTPGVALHAILDTDNYIQFLGYLMKRGIIQELKDNFFGSNCILNSFSALDNIPNQPNFSSAIHRDLRFYSGKFPIMLNCLVMIDDFTEENGGTYLLPGSHLEERKPQDKDFFQNAKQATGQRGDILIFNANVWHASAPNKTQEHRRAIPITISKPFMKQLLDYPRALGYDMMDKLSDEMAQFLGYYSRVPA